MGKRVEGEIENFPKLDRAGQRGRGKTKKNTKQNSVGIPSTPAREVYPMESIYRQKYMD